MSITVEHFAIQKIEFANCYYCTLAVHFKNSQRVAFNECLYFFQILKPSEKKAKYQYQGLNQARPVTPRGPTGVPGMKRK